MYMYTYTYTHICVLFSLYESEFLLISESKQGGFYKNPLLLLVEDIRWLVARDHRRRNGCWSLSKNCIHKNPITTLYQTDSLHLLSLSVYLWYPCLCVSLWVCVSVSVPPFLSVFSLSVSVIFLRLYHFYRVSVATKIRASHTEALCEKCSPEATLITYECHHQSNKHTCSGNRINQFADSIQPPPTITTDMHSNSFPKLAYLFGFFYGKKKKKNVGEVGGRDRRWWMEWWRIRRVLYGCSQV